MAASKKASVKPGARPFRSDREILDAALEMLNARKAVVEARRRGIADSARLRAMEANVAALTRRWHMGLRATSNTVLIKDRFRRHRLNRIECEIVAVLCLHGVLALDADIRFTQDAVKALSLPNAGGLDVMRSLSAHGRLRNSGLIDFHDAEEDPHHQNIWIADELIEALVNEKAWDTGGYPAKTEAEMYSYLKRLTSALAAKNMTAQFGLSFRKADVAGADRWVARLLKGLDATLRKSPKWKLAVLLRKHVLKPVERTILLALIGRELGHRDSSDSLFAGAGLARVISDHEYEVRGNLTWLMPDSTLITEHLIQPCGGAAETLSDDPDEIAKTEFEVTAAAREELGLAKAKWKTGRCKATLRKPKIKLSQIVLSDEARQAIGLALTHVRHEQTLTQDWGLGELIPYGRNVTLLFSGPPGTGKTACAEAIAFELGRPIAIADYSEIQNCFVGQTEKNIVRVFSEARSAEAVLFWDEADAMFYDRDAADRNWEVRDVNVLLQQLERFPGVCVLATNRKIALDKALERRITLKVDFQRPDQKMRREIWRRLMPKKLPLAQDVNFDTLSDTDLSGGEIKNVVLNAARIALEERGEGPIKLADFRKAIDTETKGRWNDENRSPIGFQFVQPAEQRTRATVKG